MKRAMPLGLVLSLALAAGMCAHAAGLPRLPAVKDFYLDTVLVSNGAAAAAIVAPDDPGYSGLAREVCEAVKALAGAELPVITDIAANAELDAGTAGGRAMIVLGNLMDNKVSERLYCMHQLDVDAAWPGENGCLVQTVHNPMGDGRNFISLGGSDFAGVRRAAQVFIGLLKPEGKSLAVGSLFRLEGGDKGPAPLGEAEIEQKGNAGPGYAVECGNILRKYRTPGYGRVFRRAMENYALSVADVDVLDEKTFKGGYPSFGELPLLWDMIEEDEQFDAADRELISNALYVYAHLLRYARLDTGDMGAGGNDHNADSALYAGLYFNRYYPGLEIGRRLVERMDRYFASPLKHWRVSDNATGYADATWSANLQYALLRPKMEYFSSGLVRKAADYHVVITSNLGRSGGFGDSLSWSKTRYNYHPAILTMASWYYRDGGYLWWFKKCGGRPGALPAAQYWGKMNEGRFIMGGLDEKPPARWLGVKPYPLDSWMYRGWKAPEPEEEHAHRYFDKMSFRAGFEATNQYLLLSGFSDGYHGHPDANSVINFTDNGFDFLDDSGYMRPDITEHSTVIVIKGESEASLPRLARIEHLADFDGLAFTETSVSSYNGTRWSRNIVWEKERYFAFFDEIEADADGEFDIRCVWQPRGNVALAGREVTARQGPQAMRLINLGGTPQALQSGGPKLIQSVSTNLDRGRKIVVANIFFVEEEGNAGAIDAESIAPGAALVKQPDGISLVGVGPCRSVAGLDTDAALFHVGPRAIRACGMTRLTLPGADIRAGKPVSVFLDFDKGTGIVEAAESARVTVGAGTGAALDARPGRTAFRFGPTSGEKTGERQRALAGMFEEAAVARRRGEAGAQARNREQLDALKSRMRVLWECRDFQPAGLSTNKPDGGRRKAEDKAVVTWLETADRDKDGKSEILVGMSEGAVVALSHGGKPLWSAPAPGMARTRSMAGGLRAVIGSPADRKILTAGGRGKEYALACIDASGARLWEAPLPVAPLILFASEPSRGGSFDIGVGAFDYVHGYSHKGRPLWKFLNQQNHGTTCGAAYDLDGDGSSEMAVGNDYVSGYVIRGSTGKSLMKIRMTWHAGPSAVALGDLDGDGKGDMVMGDRQGRVLFCVPWDATNRVTRELAATVTFVKLVDFEGDGKKETVVGTDSGGIYAFDARGVRLWRGNADAVPRDVDFGDMDGNGRPDLLLDCEDGCMRILDDRGRQIALFTAGSGARFARAVELDGDRRSMECAVGGGDGCVYALKFDGAGGK